MYVCIHIYKIKWWKVLEPTHQLFDQITKKRWFFKKFFDWLWQFFWSLNVTLHTVGHSIVISVPRILGHDIRCSCKWVASNSNSSHWTESCPPMFCLDNTWRSPKLRVETSRAWVNHVSQKTKMNPEMDWSFKIMTKTGSL